MLFYEDAKRHVYLNSLCPKNSFAVKYLKIERSKLILATTYMLTLMWYFLFVN